MPDSDLVRDILEQMLKATYTIQRRFASIQAPADFLASDEGIDRLDAICMQLIAVGESVKNLDKITGGALLSRYPDIEWRRLMGMRDFLSHHYFDLNEQIVYSVCAKHIPQLQQEIARMLKDLAADSGA
ncbi:MAG: hypothetical protein BWY52_01731 [Chloroflexi bacterium ADurb.Bin325]|nr:MAG: hypothetical protein BWY52_01731 [Chloroflexi bacterium ADurb.Bin325]